MKRTFVFLLIILINFSCSSQKLSVMTYNLRLDVASDGENAWPNRKEFLLSQLQFYSPSIFGIQEGRPNQVAFLNEKLPDYNYIGNGRDGGEEGEHTAIYYNAKQYKLESTKTFWLSETPEKLSKGWDAAYPRICTYGLFTNLESKNKVFVFNTHLDHIGSIARAEGIKLVLNEIKKVNSKNYPVILMGDFNVEPSDILIKELSENMVNTETVSDFVFGPKGTFNGFNFNEPVTRLIDYIFISKTNKIKVLKHAVLTDSNNLKYPSDHFPVFVEMYFIK